MVARVKKWWEINKPVILFVLIASVVIVSLLFSVTTILEAMDVWVWDGEKYWAVSSIMLTLLIVVCVYGYIHFPYAVITLVPDDSGGSQNKNIEVWCDGRKIPVAKFPEQFKVYFRRVGEYNIYLLQDSKIITPEKDWDTLSFYQSHIPHVTLSMKVQ